MSVLDSARERAGTREPAKPGRENTPNTSLGTMAVRLGGRLSVGAQCRRLVAEDKLSRDRLEALQERRLGRLLRDAYETVPYYRELFDQRGLTPGCLPPRELLGKLPPLTKSDIMANFPDRILRHGRRSTGSQHLASTGTTADRTDVIVSLYGQRSRLALVFWRHALGGRCGVGAKRIEIPPDACSRLCGTENGRPMGLIGEIRAVAGQNRRPIQSALRVIEKRLRSSIRHSLIYDQTLPPFGPDGTCLAEADLQRYVDVLREQRPYLVTGLPAYLQQIARHIRRTGQSVHVPVIHPMGGLSTPGLRQFIAESFSAEVYETYGSSELGGFACQCDSREWLHVTMGSYIVEVVRDGRPAKPGELGHLIVTGLENRAMPFIRYKLGDVGRWHAGSCECGRETQLIECNGRLQNLIVTGEGRPVTEEELLDLAYSDLGLEHFQLVERKRGQFDLSVVAQPGEDLDQAAIKSAFSDALDGPRRLDVFPAQTIHAEATGKFRFVKSASYEDFA